MKITVMGDLHYVQSIGYDGEGMHAAPFIEVRDRFFKDYLHAFFAIPSDYYVSVGDLTNFGTAQELTEVYTHIRSYNKQFLHALGNHDLYSMSREAVCALTGQPINYTIDTPEAKLIFWETAREMDKVVYGGTVTKEQLAWLTHELATSGDKTVLLFGHHPVYDTTHHSNYKNLSIDPAIDVAAVLRTKQQGQAFYICGHTHYDSIVKKDNWTFVQIAAVLDVPAVRFIDISEDLVTIRAHTILTDDYVEDGKAIADKMTYFESCWNAQGTTLTRNIVVPLTVSTPTR